MNEFMKSALREARTGAEESGVPIGAALVNTNGRLVATGQNHRVHGNSEKGEREVSGSTLRDNKSGRNQL